MADWKLSTNGFLDYVHCTLQSKTNDPSRLDKRSAFAAVSEKGTTVIGQTVRPVSSIPSSDKLQSSEGL